MSSTRASLKSQKTRGFQTLRFAFEAWTTHLPAGDLLRNVLDAPSPETVHRRNLRAPLSANALPLSPGRPLRIARFHSNARTRSSAADSGEQRNYRTGRSADQRGLLDETRKNHWSRPG